jgi:hypothetical protein
MSTCAWPPANTGTEIGSVVVRAATRRIWASGSATVPAGPNRYRVLVPAGSYYERKQTEHKTPAEALRSLKRQLAKVVYRKLRDDHTHRASPIPKLT